MINLIEGRSDFQTIGNTYPVADNIIREEVIIAGVPCTWFTPADAEEDNIVIYIHGGAFIFGSTNSHAPMVSYIARELNRKVLMINYRLAPEHPFPAGIVDCTVVINAFCEENPDITFGIIGDSAGGNLTMTTQLVLRDTKGPAAQYTIVISPWTDLECKSESHERNKKVDTVLTTAYLVEAAGMYAPSQNLSTPVLSPVNAKFDGFAPVLILSGTYEILQDDSINLHKRLVESGVEAELESFEGQLHVWPFMDIHTEASRKALSKMADFAAKHSTVKN
ncbi:MAG: alpha/beta hydrolase [Mucilaginibacter sp.]|uniref:alpha/beta hydrolase n=1 Tax=Mucilaginibacter sp. TaxID=1882438 RepID=UPI0031B0DBAA